MIRTSKHSLKFSNTNKINTLNAFIDEYRIVAGKILDEIWNNGYKTFNVSLQQYILPKYIDYNEFEIETSLSARALSSLTTQLSGVIRACVEKQNKRIYQYNKTTNKHLKKAIDSFKTSKPNISNLNPELSSKCVDIEYVNGEFFAFLRLRSIGKDFGHIKIPIKMHKHSNRFINWNLMNSFSISKENISIRWSKEIDLKSDGIIVGADQGQNICLTLSDGQRTQQDIHGHTLKSICDKMSRKQKGSKSFRRAQDHRNNYINWSINQLNFDKIKEIRYEKVFDMYRGKNTSRSLKHFSYPLIERKIERHAELHGVHLIKQSSAFRSQRCCECGWVQKSNRKSESFLCKLCSHSANADMNAAKNHEIDLPNILNFVKSKLNLKGFFWNPDGIYDRFGQEIRVSVPFKI